MNTNFCKKQFIDAVFIFTAIYGAQTVKSQTVTVSNKSAKMLKDYTVEVSLSKFTLPAGSYIVISPENETVPLEISSDLTGKPNGNFSCCRNQTLFHSKLFHQKRHSRQIS